MTPRSVLRTSLAGVCATATAAALMTTTAGAANAAPAARPTLGGQAYGSSVALGTAFTSGPSALVPLCTREVGKANSDNTLAVNIPGVGTIGAVTTSVASSNPAPGQVSTTSTSNTAATNLLAAIHFDAVATTAQATRHNSDGSTALTGGASFVGLSILGQSMPTDPAPNTTVAIPGVATILLNGQTTSQRFGSPKITVTAMKITIGASGPLGPPAGTIVIGRSVATVHGPTNRLVTGSAYATHVVAGDGAVRSGRTAPAYMPCGGTTGGWNTRNATIGTLLPNVLNADTATSRVRSYETGDTTVAHTEDRIAGATLFGGMVSAQAITAQATATRAHHHLTQSSDGTTIGRLTIAGQVQPISTDPNQSYSVPGLGTLWVNRVITGKNGLQVYALQLVLGQASGGLPAGAVINVGAANAGVLAQ